MVSPPFVVTWSRLNSILQATSFCPRGRLAGQWKVRPHFRKLRAFIAEQGFTNRGLERGRIRYRLDAVDRLLSGYVPIENFASLVPSADVNATLLNFVTLKIGNIVLISKDDTLGFLQALQSTGRGATPASELRKAS